MSREMFETYLEKNTHTFTRIDKLCRTADICSHCYNIEFRINDTIPVTAKFPYKLT